MVAVLNMCFGPRPVG